MMNSLGVYWAFPERWPLLLLVAGVLLCMMRAARFRTKALRQLGITNDDELDRAGLAVPRNRRIKNALYFTGVLFVAIACLGPQWGQKEHAVKAEGLDICFALDLSNSMMAEDVSPSRLEQAKNQLSIFMQRLGGDRAAVVGFSGSGFVAAPLSVDHSSLTNFLEPLNPSFVSDHSTNLGAGVEACMTALELDKIRNRDEIVDLAAKLIVLVSDGEDTVDEDNDAINRAERLGVPVYAMAVGTAKGAPIPIRDENGNLMRYVKDPSNGQVVVTKLLDKGLKELAKKTGGQVFYTSTGLDAWNKFEQAIANYKRDSRDAGTKLDREDRFQWPLLLGFLFLLLDFFMTETKMNLFARRTKLFSLWALLLGAAAMLGIVPRAAHAANPSSAKPGTVYYNNKALGALNKKDLFEAQRLLGEALSQDASDPIVRFNWATTKLYSSVKAADQGAGGQDQQTRIDTKSLDESIKELEALKHDPSLLKHPQGKQLRQAINYQLGQAYELKQEIPNALESYYSSVAKGANAKLAKKAKNNISRLLTAMEQGQGQGQNGQQQQPQNGQGQGQDQKQGQGGDKKDNQNYSQGQGQTKPKFSGTELNESEARQILQSVSGEEREVLRRKAQDEARTRSRRNGSEQGVDGSGGKQW